MTDPDPPEPAGPPMARVSHHLHLHRLRSQTLHEARVQAAEEEARRREASLRAEGEG